MGIKWNIEAALKDSFVMKIDRQPCNDGLLKHELSMIAASILTTNGGRMHGYIGLLV